MVPVEGLGSEALGLGAVRTATPQHLKTTNKDRIASLRAELSEEEQLLLQLRVDRDLAFREIAQAMAEPGVVLDEQSLTRAAARWRKRYQLTKERLRELAVASCLLELD